MRDLAIVILHRLRRRTAAAASQAVDAAAARWWAHRVTQHPQQRVTITRTTVPLHLHHPARGDETVDEAMTRILNALRAEKWGEPCE